MNRKSLFLLLSTASLLAACGENKPISSSVSSTAPAVTSSLQEEKILVKEDAAVTKVTFYDSFDVAKSELGKVITSWGGAEEIYATVEVKEGYKVKTFDAFSSLKDTISSNGGAYGRSKDGAAIYRLKAEEGKTLDKTDTIVVNVRKIRSITGEGIENATLDITADHPAEGDTVSFVLTPNDGYSVAEVQVSAKTSKENLSVQRGEGDAKNQYSFQMVDDDAVIRATIVTAANVTIIVSKPVSYVYDFSLTGETSAATVNADGANGAFTIGETVQVLARVNDFAKTVKAKLGENDVSLEWNAIEGGYVGSFNAPNQEMTFAFVEGDAQEERTLLVSFSGVEGVMVSYWDDPEDSDTKSDEIPSPLYDHQSLYMKINEPAADGQTYLVEMKADGDDEYTEIDPEADYARFYYVSVEGNTRVRISYQ